MKSKTISAGRFFACFAPQAAGSPLVDKSLTTEKEHPNRIGYGYLIRLPFTGNNPTTGLVIGMWNGGRNHE